MKRIIAVTTILLATGCSIFHYKDPVAEKEAEILKLMATIRPNLTYQVGEPWFIFSYQQHDELTLDALLNLSKTASDENVRGWAFNSLSHQKNPRLIPFWQDILDNRDKGDKRTVHAAISGLGAIHAPQSNSILLALLSEPDTSPELLSHICFAYQNSYMPKEVLDQIVALTAHTSEQVRVAAFEAVPYHPEHALVTQALRNELLRRALSDPSPKIVHWGLRSLLGAEPPPELFPITLNHLNHADPSIRVLADEALRSLLLDAAVNRAEKFEMCKKALQEKRWSYQTAPLLTSQYARILEEEKSEFAEAEQAYQTAQQAYASNDAYNAWNNDPGATMLYRLIQVKQKRGDIKGAIAVLNRLVKEYPADTRIYAHDFPAPGYNMVHTVTELAPKLRTILEGALIKH